MSSVIINKIELQNWFNFKGDFEDNRIDFKDGLNIFTGDNNAGKTKLHNAFRWILKNEVIINKSNEAVKESISNNNLRKVVNHSTFRETALDAQVEIGVRLTFTKKRKNDGPRPWTEEDMLTLTRLLAKFPGGTSNRWDR